MNGKRLMAAVVLGGAVLGSMAFAMGSERQVDEAQVDRQIDARLHAVLVKLRLERQAELGAAR